MVPLLPMFVGCSSTCPMPLCLAVTITKQHLPAQPNFDPLAPKNNLPAYVKIPLLASGSKFGQAGKSHSVIVTAEQVGIGQVLLHHLWWMVLVAVYLPSTHLLSFGLPTWINQLSYTALSTQNKIQTFNQASYLIEEASSTELFCAQWRHFQYETHQLIFKG